MISRLRGTILQKSATEVVIDCNGVGYSVNISLNTSAKLPDVKEEAVLETILIPREDALNLYGFYDDAERVMFRHLISVSGIGAKTAMAILSSLSVDEFKEFIYLGNVAGLQRLPGIGRKTAERLILELKDKVSKISSSDLVSLNAGSASVKHEAVLALVALGYSQQNAEKSVFKVLSELPDDASLESIIRLALKNSGK